MKIYFEDGKLNNPPKEAHVTVEAGNGATTCLNQLHQAEGSNLAVYTNFIWALNSNYHWNYSDGRSELYFRKSGRWVNVHNMTRRIVRSSMNFVNMFANKELL